MARRSGLAGDQRGVAAVEFALVAGTLIFVILNCADVARFYLQRMQMQNATRMAVQAAWNSCDESKLPATVNCPGLATAVATAVKSTSLGTAVTLKAGSPSEGYYCVNNSGVLARVSDVSAKPSDCSSVGKPADQPGDYVQVQTQYSFKPMFGGLSIGATLPSTVTSTALMRLK